MRQDVKTRASQQGAVKGTASSVALRRWARGRVRDSARKEAMFL